jgi:putative N6-adenine-specific DNA methylase
LASVSNRLLSAYGKTGLKTSTPQKLFVRIHKDRCTLSLDSSGELLHRRGLRPDVGKAPLRETLAAAALDLAGYTGKEPLMDPMCGFGAFSLEGAMKSTRTPPGWFREFAFFGWPCFGIKRWNHMKKTVGRAMETDEGKPLIYAMDIDPKPVSALSGMIKSHKAFSHIQVNEGDFFHLSPSGQTPEPGIVALNPPYGRRLGTRREMADLYQRIFQRFKAVWRNWRYAVFIPDRRFISFAPESGRVVLFRHGGRKVWLVCGRIG